MYVGDIFTVFSLFGSCITHAVPLGLKANFKLKEPFSATSEAE